MILINEWLPNPSGSDTAQEWVELFNNGEATVSLNGWKITSGESKFYIGNRTIRGEEYLLLKRADTKLVLKNADGEVYLYDAGGNLEDHSSFLGTAPEGKSFGRTLNGEFLWLTPTPGAKNIIPAETGIIRNEYPFGISLNKGIGPAEFFGLMIGAALTLTALIMIVLERNESLFKLFFGGDEKIR